jgi:endonuclease YncB( thermonuclease family)
LKHRALSRRALAAALALAATLGLVSNANADANAGQTRYDGRVVEVIDGDTIEVLVEGVPKEMLRIRLSGIDTPERGQPWARRARQALAARVGGAEVRINAVTTDRYGRIVGEVYADDVCVNCELVREGHAWVYRRYTSDAVLIGLEEEARRTGRGLWGLPAAERIPPWEWRRGAREPRAPGADRNAEAAPTDAGSLTCGAKRYCKEMRTCEEARFYLTQCGLERLDGDGDGTPCEKLCRRR